MRAIFMPEWVKPRSNWQYVGWISRNPGADLTFEGLCEKARKSDHEELREVDIYPEGAACWVREEKEGKE